MISKDAIGDRVNEFILSAYGSLAEAGRKLGLHPTTLGGAIKGKWLPNERVLHAMRLTRMDITDSTGKVIGVYYEEEKEVKERKFHKLYRDMTTTSKKVYDVVPLDEEWPVNKIVSELNRRGSNINYPAVEACLNQMRESGLINRNANMEYSREAVELASREEQPPIEKEEPVQQLLNPVLPAPVAETFKESLAVAPKTPLDIMAELSERANSMRFEMVEAMAKMNFLLGDVQRLTDDIDQAALTIQEQFESDARELIELREMKTTLKKLMG